MQSVLPLLSVLLLQSVLSPVLKVELVLFPGLAVGVWKLAAAFTVLLPVQSETERGPECLCSQHTRELISTQKMSQKHEKDPSRLLNSPGMQVNTRYINSTRCTSSQLTPLRVDSYYQCYGPSTFSMHLQANHFKVATCLTLFRCKPTAACLVAVYMYNALICPTTSLSYICMGKTASN